MHNTQGRMWKTSHLTLNNVGHLCGSNTVQHTKVVGILTTGQVTYVLSTFTANHTWAVMPCLNTEALLKVDHPTCKWKRLFLVLRQPVQQ